MKKKQNLIFTCDCGFSTGFKIEYDDDYERIRYFCPITRKWKDDWKNVYVPRAKFGGMDVGGLNKKYIPFKCPKCKKEFTI